MDDEQASPTPGTAATSGAPDGSEPSGRALWAERTGEPVYVARNERGAQVRIGSAGTEGAFSPGELLQLALATCSALSADHVLRSRLGDDFAATVGVSADPVTDEKRYGSFVVELLADMDGMEEDRRDSLVERTVRAAERQCTVGRTLKAGATYDLQVRNEVLGAPEPD